VQPVGVVDVFDEGADAGVGVGEIGVGSPVDLLDLERLHEAFGLGVVVRVARPAHRALEAERFEPGGVFARGVLHAAVRMVDEAGRRVARGDRLVQRRKRQARLQMIVERPTDDLARESVDDDGEIDEPFAEPDESDVGDPELVEAGGRQPAREVGQDRIGMAALRRGGNERLAAQRQQVVGPHQAKHALGVDDQAFVPQPPGNAPIAFAPPLQRQALDQIGKVGVLALAEFGLAPAVEARPRQAGDPAQMRDVGGVGGLAFRSCAGHFFDDREEMGAPLPRRFSSHDRKASRKKSRSACWRSASRSSSPMRALAFVHPASGRAGGSGRLRPSPDMPPAVRIAT